MLLALLFATQIAVTAPGTTPQTQAAIDVDTRQAVVVWTEQQQIRLSRIRFDGTRLDDGLAVASGAIPRIAFDGVNHLIVWIDNGDIAGRFFTPDGDFIGEAFPIAAGKSADHVALAWLGSNYVAVWSGPNAGAATIDVTGAVDRFDIFQPTENVVGDLSVGNDAIVAYGTKPTIAMTTIATLVLNGKTPTQRATITTRTVGVGNAGQIFVHTPRVDGNVIGWTQQNGPGRGSEAWITRLDANGAAVGDPLSVGVSFGSSSFPLATATPVDSRVITVDYPSLTEVTFDFDCRCLSKRVLSQALTSAAPSFTNIAAAALPKKGTVVAYELGTREEGEPFLNARPRVFVQFLDQLVAGRRRLWR